jgi:hypothetical protein
LSRGGPPVSLGNLGRPTDRLGEGSVAHAAVEERVHLVTQLTRYQVGVRIQTRSTALQPACLPAYRLWYQGAPIAPVPVACMPTYAAGKKDIAMHLKIDRYFYWLAHSCSHTRTHLDRCAPHPLWVGWATHAHRIHKRLGSLWPLRSAPQTQLILLAMN